MVYSHMSPSAFPKGKMKDESEHVVEDEEELKANEGVLVAVRMPDP